MLRPRWSRGSFGQVRAVGRLEAAAAACVRCGASALAATTFAGCQGCGESAPLELTYPAVPSGRLPIGEAIAWARRYLQPLAASERVDLGGRATPLIAVPRLGAGVHLKLEAFHPTGSHKDRYHAVAAGIAKRLGFSGLVTTSTGNHGVSAAAFAAAAELPAVVLCHPNAPDGLLRTIHAFGGLAARLPAEEARVGVIDLVEQGWFPATSMDPLLSGRANPFGAEGYKAFAYETVEQLGRLPGAVVVPTASGDTLYGVSRGFLELASLTGRSPPVVLAVQPASANSLSRSVAAGRPQPVEARSIALSISDRVTGRQAMVALERSGGRALDVSDADIRAAVRDLARVGVYVEPASAAGLAGYWQAVERGIIDVAAPTVIMLTSSGFKWPETMAQIFDARPAQSLAELRAQLSATGAVQG